MVRIASLSLLLLCPLGGTAATGQSAVGRQLAPTLLLHDAGPAPAPAEQQSISWTRDLLGHFDTNVTVAHVQSYRPGSIDSHQATIFLGLRPGVKLPDAFLADCAKAKRPLCWIGANVDQLLITESAGRFGFRLEPRPPGAQAARVAYEDASYWRDEASLPPITITAPNQCQPVALVEGHRPYAVRSGTFWYFAELPLHPVHAPGAHLIICDQMHDILDDPHDIARTALLSITGITPETDSGKLNVLIRQLQAASVPFAVEVAPAVRQADSGELVPLDRQRRLVSILRGAQRAGASIVAVLPEPEDGDQPVRDTLSAPTTIARRFEDTLVELARCGLYPIAWSVDRETLSERDASQLGQLCSTVLDRQGADNEAAHAPLMPFLVARDAHGQRVMFDNLPRLRRGQGEVEAMLDAANRQAVPDPWVTAAIAPVAPVDAVSQLIDSLRAAEYRFYDLRFEANSTTGASIQVRTVSDPRDLGDLLPTGWDATILGPEAGARINLDRPSGERLTKTIVRPGAILVTYAAGKRPKVVLSVEGDAEQVTQRGVQRIAQIVVMFALAAGIVLFVIYLLQLVQRRGA